MSDRAPTLDEFLAQYDEDDWGTWQRYTSLTHMNVLDEAVTRMRAAEAALAST